MSKIPDAVREQMAAWGKRGGKSTSPAKAKASAENGKLGGRPRKKKSAPKKGTQS